MLKDKLEALGNTQANRRTVLKGLLVGLGAGVLVQAAGGVTAFAREQEQKEPEKTGKKKVEKAKEGEGGKKLENGKSGSKSKNEKKKTEEPKNQHKK